jgi:hypothetical protein
MPPGLPYLITLFLILSFLTFPAINPLPLIIPAELISLFYLKRGDRNIAIVFSIEVR